MRIPLFNSKLAYACFACLRCSSLLLSFFEKGKVTKHFYENDDELPIGKHIFENLPSGFQMKKFNKEEMIKELNKQ